MQENGLEPSPPPYKSPPVEKVKDETSPARFFMTPNTPTPPPGGEMIKFAINIPENPLEQKTMTPSSQNGDSSDYDRALITPGEATGQTSSGSPTITTTPVTPLSKVQSAAKTWSVDQVISWLSALGPAYKAIAPDFKQYGIDGEMLFELSEELLTTGLNISNPLVRRKILLEVNKLKEMKSRGETTPPHRRLSHEWSSAVASPFTYPLSGNLPFQEIPFKDLNIIKKVGEGAYGSAHIAKWRGTMVVVKRLHRVLLDADIKDFCNEIRLMEKVGRHPCVISLVGACLTPPDVCLVTEYAANGSVFDLVMKQGALTKPEDLRTLIRIAVDASAGLMHLHSEGVVHRDIACRNIVVDKEFNARICDFGRSKNVGGEENKSQTIIGPVKWMAPESLRDKEHTFKSDVYMFGITLWEMFARSTPYPNMNNLDAAFAVTGKNLRPQTSTEVLRNCPKPIIQLMTECWAEEPVSRPTMIEINQRLRYIMRLHEPHPFDKVNKPRTRDLIREKVMETTKVAQESVKEGILNLNKFFINISSCRQAPASFYDDDDE